MIKTGAIKLGASLAAVLGMAACTAETGDTSEQDIAVDESALKQWKRGTWELKLAAGPSQFSPLRTLLKSAEVVGIGESIHMTGTQHALRVDAMKYMIEHLNFRTIGIETGYLTAKKLTAYLAGEHNSLGQAMDSVITAFTSVEDAEFYKWVKNWNQTHPNDRVSAFGFDVQDFESADYLRKQGKALGLATPPQFSSCFCANVTTAEACANGPDGPIAWGQAFVGPRYESCVADIQKEANLLVEAHFRAKTTAVRQSVEEAQLVLSMLRAYTQQVHTQFVDESMSNVFRDEAMADIAARMVKKSGEKAIFIAHNGHLDKANASLDQKQRNMNLPMFGGYFRQRFGSGYKTIGQFSFNTTIDWGGIPQPVPHNRAGAYERMLKETGKGYLLVNNADNALFGKSDLFFMEDGMSTKSLPSEHYDLSIYSETSVGMKRYGSP